MRESSYKRASRRKTSAKNERNICKHGIILLVDWKENEFVEMRNTFHNHYKSETKNKLQFIGGRH